MKGAISIVEAVMAVMIIMIGITLIYPIRERSELDFTYLSHNCLKTIDDEGYLGYYIENDMMQDLNNSLRNCLPGVVDFTFKYCDTALCNPDVVGANRDIFVSSYLLSGYEKYDSKLVNVWVWLK